LGIDRTAHRRRWIAATIVCVCVVAGLTGVFAVRPAPTPLDTAVARRAATFPEALVPALRIATWLGASITVASLAGVVALFTLAIDRNPMPAVYLSVVILGELVLANGLKAVVDRPRPDIDQLVGWSGSSFPSGHSAAAAAAYLAVALVLTRDRAISEGSDEARDGIADRLSVRWWALAIPVAIALTVAASRVLLGVHWTTDVIAGLTLGWGLALAGAIVCLGRRAAQYSPRRRIALGRPSGSTRVS
jgi:membrane-associated phospholipid phosphatase